MSIGDDLESAVWNWWCSPNGWKDFSLGDVKVKLSTAAAAWDFLNVPMSSSLVFELMTGLIFDTWAKDEDQIQDQVKSWLDITEEPGEEPISMPEIWKDIALTWDTQYINRGPLKVKFPTYPLLLWSIARHTPPLFGMPNTVAQLHLRMEFRPYREEWGWLVPVNGRTYVKREKSWCSGGLTALREGYHVIGFRESGVFINPPNKTWSYRQEWFQDDIDKYNAGIETEFTGEFTEAFKEQAELYVESQGEREPAIQDTVSCANGTVFRNFGNGTFGSINSEIGVPK